MRIDQFVTSVRPHDAVTEHALALADILGEFGPTRMWAEHIHPDLTGVVSALDRYDGGADIVLYHASIGSAVGNFLLRRKEPLVLYFHNVTPPEFFRSWEPHFVPHLEQGLRHLRGLTPRAMLSITPSDFNADELRELGARDVEVIPILLDESRYEVAPHPATAAELRAHRDAGGDDLVFIGRTAPNKRQDLLVRAFAAYREMYGADARLHIVGGEGSVQYERALNQLIATLRLDDAVTLPGIVDQSRLMAYLQECSLFVSASEHEGFFVPAVEAMQAGLPIVARAAGAVPETVGDAGVLLPEVDAVQMAAAWRLVLSDPARKARLAARGRERAAGFAADLVAERYRDLFKRIEAERHAR